MWLVGWLVNGSGIKELSLGYMIMLFWDTSYIEIYSGKIDSLEISFFFL